MSAAVLLDRLGHVRQVGPGRWMARCPAHEDRQASLSVRELDDGRVLVHDFGGCETADVLGAAGLTMAELFPAGSRGEFPPSRSRIPAGDVLAALGHEITVAWLILTEVMERRRLAPEQYERLTMAANRIGRAAHGRS